MLLFSTLHVPDLKQGNDLLDFVTDFVRVPWRCCETIRVQLGTPGAQLVKEANGDIKTRQMQQQLNNNSTQTLGADDERIQWQCIGGLR